MAPPAPLAPWLVLAGVVLMLVAGAGFLGWWLNRPPASPARQDLEIHVSLSGHRPNREGIYELPAEEPIHLIVQGDTFVTTADLDYHDGERYPSLARVDGTPDYLDDITKPLTTPEKIPAEQKQD